MIKKEAATKKPQRKPSKAAVVLRDLTQPTPPKLSVSELVELTESTQQAANGWFKGLWVPSLKKRQVILKELARRGIEFDDSWWLITEGGKPIKRKRKVVTA